MTLKEFEYLSFDEKLEIIWEKGEFVDTYISKVEYIHCFSVNRFFVELVYSENRNDVKDIRGFVTGFSLDKYVVNFNNCNNQL